MISELDRLQALLRDLYRQRPFENYTPAPDAEERKRRAVQEIPLALPEKPA